MAPRFRYFQFFFSDKLTKSFENKNTLSCYWSSITECYLISVPMDCKDLTKVLKIPLFNWDYVLQITALCAYWRDENWWWCSPNQEANPLETVKNSWVTTNQRQWKTTYFHEMNGKLSVNISTTALAQRFVIERLSSLSL